MRAAGYVLVGGVSSRMGADKALLAWQGRPMAESIAAVVAEACGSAALIGQCERYRHLPLPLIQDQRPGCGPLAGLEAALLHARTGWVLLVACDLPLLTPALLRSLLDQIPLQPHADVIVPRSREGWEPLCALYHARLLPRVAACLDAGKLRMHDLIRAVPHAVWDPPPGADFRNLNTPDDWTAAQPSSGSLAR